MKKYNEPTGSFGKVIPITRAIQSPPPAKPKTDRDLALEQEFTTIADFFDQFKDESACLTFLDTVRWKNGPVCPYCGKQETITKEVKGYRCGNAACKRPFTVIKATLFDNSRIPLRSWFAAIYLCVSDTYGINSSQLARYLHITQKSAWFLAHRIRELFRYRNEKLFGIVEADETYIGGKSKNKHASNKKEKTQGRSLVDKIPVVGMVERNGRLVARAVENVRLKTLKDILLETVEEGSVLITDELSSYNFASGSFYHVTMQHNKAHYVNDEFHTNTIEGCWGIFKRGITGTFSHVGKGYLQRYLDEFVFRYNHRSLNASQRFMKVMELACQQYVPYRKLKRDAATQVRQLTPVQKKVA